MRAHGARSLCPMRSAVLVAFFLAAEPRGQSPPGACKADSDCVAPRMCGCGVRVACSWLRPGTFYSGEDGGVSRPGPTRCMTLDEALAARAVRLKPNIAGSRSCDAGCYPWIPDCQADEECPKGQVCVCRGPHCSVRKTVTFDLMELGDAAFRAPYSTKMCMPMPDAGSGVTY